MSGWHQAGVTLAPEVNTKYREVEKRTKTLNYRATGSEERQVGPVPGQGEQGRSSAQRRRQLGITAGGYSPAKPTRATTPPLPKPELPAPDGVSEPARIQIDDRGARQLSDHYWKLLGSPSAHANKLAHAWPSLFDPLLSQHTTENLLGAMDWAWGESDFWPRLLQRVKGDPAKYFLSKLDTIMGQYRAERVAAQNAAKKESTKNATEPEMTEDMRLVVSMFPEE